MIDQADKLFKRFYNDHRYRFTTKFFANIRSHLRPEHRVLNLGAGPTTQDPNVVKKGEAAEVVGADIDPVVLNNHELDRAVLIENGRLPFEDSYFDIAFSDFVLEHVEKPQQFLDEVSRVLKPGGMFFFRTPNIYHYVTIISRFSPHWFHNLIANKARGLAEKAQDPWPTFYRLNTRSVLRKAASLAGFKSAVELEMVEGHPSYLMFHSLPFLVGVAYERLVNSTEALAGLRANIFGRLVK